MSSEAEGHVWVRCAADIELFGVEEHGSVEICRFEEQQHFLACLQLRTEEIGITCQGSSHVLDRRRPPQHLFHRQRNGIGIVDQFSMLVRMTKQLFHAAAQDVPCGLVTADENQ
ncbi:hypothetical protein GCM10020255_050960 [Rhodococcus baikonurensis]